MNAQDVLASSDIVDFSATLNALARAGHHSTTTNT
jgi:hypothetical protein